MINNARTVTLSDGGSITLSGDFNALDLSVEDKDLIDSILKLFREYEAAQ